MWLIYWSRWKSLDNVYRKKWAVSAVPTLVKFERVDGRVIETGRLVESELVDEKNLRTFIKG